MYYGFVKLSGKWHGKQFPTLNKAEKWAGEIARQGDVSALCDDPEWFASEMDIDKEDIQW